LAASRDHQHGFAVKPLRGRLVLILSAHLRYNQLVIQSISPTLRTASANPIVGRGSFLRDQRLLSENPYQSSLTSNNSRMPSRNLAGSVGFSLSLVGVIGLSLIGPVMPAIGMCMTLFCLLGLVTSIVGLFRSPRRLAGWGVALGILGSLYLPTLYLSIFELSRR
jgi:hypothetical protein